MSGIGKCLRLSQATDRCINNAVGLKLSPDTSETWQTETFQEYLAYIEEADKLARQGSESITMGQKLVFGIRASTVKSATKDDIASIPAAKLINLNSYRRTKIFVKELVVARAVFLLSFKKCNMESLTGLLMRHCFAKAHGKITLKKLK